MSLLEAESKKDKVLFVGFNGHTSNTIKDILSLKQETLGLDIVFENNLLEVKDVIASDFTEILAVFVNTSFKYIKGIAVFCGYLISIASLIQDALESDIAVVLSCSDKKNTVAGLFSELGAKKEEDFWIVRDVDTEYLPILIGNIQKNKQQKYTLV